MKHLVITSILLFIFSSCCKLKSEDFAYYCDDYKITEVSILDTPSSEIDALWVEFSDHKKGDNQYTLIVKSDGEFIKEFGTYETDWSTDITFNPEQGDSYVGSWIGGKEKFSISYDSEQEITELVFFYKEVK